MSKLVLVDSDALRKVAGLIQAAKPLLEREAKGDSRGIEFATKVAQTMVEAGLLDPDLKSARAKLFAEKSAELDNALAKIAKACRQPQQIGKPDGAEKKAETADEVFARRLIDG